ncbi:hypothetical protein [Metapseudomonas lalkuanensis]|uniref:hypothetical protein n=1 Tax=Metapseudomonas lalkuanensis TaxID=2604832 RepID=UPI001FCEDA67|nr:hypothetical protein [Pseudomonas lalkuanensis]
MAESSNFAFLREYDPVFLQLASTAEQVFAADPSTTLIKLRQLGEALAQDLASCAGIEFDNQTTQADLLYELGREIQLDRNIVRRRYCCTLIAAANTVRMTTEPCCGGIASCPATRGGETVVITRRWRVSSVR